MDDLQDAIEDAQFINAMHDDTPKPTLEWEFPSLEEVDAYVTKLKQKNEELLEMAGICTNCLGFYLVCSFSLCLCLTHSLCLCLSFSVSLSLFVSDNSSHCFIR